MCDIFRDVFIHIIVVYMLQRLTCQLIFHSGIITAPQIIKKRFAGMPECPLCNIMPDEGAEGDQSVFINLESTVSEVHAGF